MKRTEVHVRVQTPDGPKTVSILSDITVDDLVLIGLTAYVHEVRLKRPYVSPFSRATRDAITRVLTATRS